MKTRRLGKTELQVSEIGFGGEWLERHPEEESIELIHYASAQGINILDCWMPDRNPEISLGRESGRTVTNGLFRDISDQHGRTSSITVPERWNMCVLHLRIF
mgnify:CR=1 FL=1